MNIQEKDKKNPTIYSVNGEHYETYKKKLTVRFIFENAGFIPIESYKLIRDDGNKELDNYDSEENIHDNECFTALFKDPTPVSEV